MFRRIIATLLLCAIGAGTLPAEKVDRGEAMYVGGTIAGLSEGTMGRLETTSDKVLVFQSPKGNFEVPYENVTSLEYGQKAGRRLGLALTVSILFIFSKKRKHFLTINFDDEAGKKQGAVFELSKGIVRETLRTLETNSGKKVEYESDDARKHAEKR